MAKSCRVTFRRDKLHSGRLVWGALKWERGRVVNAINYPHTKKRLTKADKARARAMLCR